MDGCWFIFHFNFHSGVVLSEKVGVAEVQNVGIVRAECVMWLELITWLVCSKREYWFPTLS